MNEMPIIDAIDHIDINDHTITESFHSDFVNLSENDIKFLKSTKSRSYGAQEILWVNKLLRNYITNVNNDQDVNVEDERDPEYGISFSVIHPVTKCEKSCFVSIEFTQWKVLELFYHDLNGTKWNNNQNWLKSDMPLKTWHGITVNDDGAITGIDLQDNNLSGHIPACIGCLTSLNSLTIQNNNITGSFDS